ncbi:hypothetical protein HMPREF9087_1942 [Enterococcus casseliflavus ATCC 12755]|uniref:Solute-binding protein family 5 domain-containing protein n=1 Tax=Enterococcus casseliflavus ATCC 12755 TaxID=888066 RepID=F0EKN6_ENTCA|nr:ABC transporter substrate-binding protein [Enterococcus casseliflavus]EGC69327.1 hypothetical protein HMPREF9087_1942 [Enterococcus casseliflavus ATCC 12755]
MKKTKFGMITLLAALVLGACGQSNEGGTDSTDTGESSTDAAASDISTMPLAVVNDGEVMDGGTLDVAVVMDTQFQGLFQWEFYQDTYDNDFMLPSHEQLFLRDADFKIIDGGAADLDLDIENNIATITLRDDLKWSDGEEVTAEDVIFSYEVIGHQDYTGIRYDNTFTNVVGMEEYHNGDSDTISGITAVSDKVVEIEFKEMHPGMMQLGGGVWYSARLIDFQAFYDKLKNDDPDIDVYLAAWGTGSDPSPTGLWGPNSAFNYTRYESERNTELLAAIDSNDSFDEEKRKEAFDAWQEYVLEEAFGIPTLYRNQVLPVSDRVANFTWAYDADHNPWARIGVTSESR